MNKVKGLLNSVSNMDKAMTMRFGDTRFQASYAVILITFWIISISTTHADLVAHWQLDGNLKDSALFGRIKDDGKFVGKSIFQEGKIGKGIVLDGSNYVSIPTSPDLEAPNKSISISAWFRVDAWPERYETLLAKGYGNKYRLARHAIDPNRLAYFGGIHKDPLEAPAGGVVNDGRWHHVVAVTVAHTKTPLFIDGVLVKSGGSDMATLGDSGHPLLLGKNPENSWENQDGEIGNWIGAIDDVGIFSTALTALEAQSIYILSTDKVLRYNLGASAQLIRLHREQSPNHIKIGNRKWKYTAYNPADGQLFVLLSENGSGVTTSPKPSVVSFSISSRFLDSGESAQLQWSTTEDAKEILITPHPYIISQTSGTMTIIPKDTTEYKITVRNEHGTSYASATVHVDYVFSKPHISEFMADSIGEYPDEDGESSDWIELFNPGPNIASTSNLFLTDDMEQLTKWPIPEMVMEQNDSIVVFASGKNRQNIDSELHTNFKLRTKGEYLALVHSSSQISEVISFFGHRYPKQKRGVSFGVDLSGTTGPLSVASPGDINTEVVTGNLSSVRFSHERALCESPFQLVLLHELPSSTIYFTTNGSVPIPVAGQLYLDPISITSTTVVRAAAFQKGMRRSPVSTHTYVFPEAVVRQSKAPIGFPDKWESLPADYEMDLRVTEDVVYRADLLKGLHSIPTMSISIPQSDLFGPNGIYSHPMDHGKAWERACSLEFIQPDETQGFQTNCGLRIYGGFGRNRVFPKHSLRVLFKGIYGATKLNFPLFPDEEATTSFDTLIFRGGFNNSWQIGSVKSQHLRDEFIRRSQLAMGQPSSHGIFAHLYLNGLYWGVYNVVERPSGAFAAAYLGGKRDDYDALNSGKAIDGTVESWRKMHELARQSTPGNVVENLSSFVDLDNLIDYMLVNFYGGNDDWDSHNWYAARKRKPNAKYHFFCWDSERTLENAEGDDKTHVNRVNNPSFLFNQLLRDESFRQRVLQRVQLHFFGDGALTPERAATRYLKLATEIHDAIVVESARWGDAQKNLPLTRNDAWIPERDRLLKTWFPKRTAIVVQQLNAAGNLGHIKPPHLKVNGNAIEILTTSGTVYFTTDGSDPRQKDGSPNPAAIVLKESSAKEVLLPKSSKWRYLDDGSNQGKAWFEPEFNDSNWKSGKAKLGYGNDGEVTKVQYGANPEDKYITTYFRRSFSLSIINGLDSFQLMLSRDDGAVIYLNGKEILRSNMPNKDEITYRTLAMRTHDEQQFFAFDIPFEFLTLGKNVIAVEVHQGTPASSDIGFDLAIQRLKKSRTTLPQGSIIKARSYANRTWSPLSIHPPVTNE